MQVWKYDENKIFTRSRIVDEVGQNMTTVPLLSFFVKPTFNEQTQEWFEGATKEEIKQWEEENKPVPPEPTELDILKQEVETLKESQQVQDFLIDDIVFEVIPMLDNNSQVQSDLILNALNAFISHKKEYNGMSDYLAQKIIQGKDYTTVFKTRVYQFYQEDVNAKLEAQGMNALIKNERG